MTARSALYRAASLLGDLHAARRGPAAFGRRIVRKRVYARSGALLRAAMRGVRLDG